MFVLHDLKCISYMILILTHFYYFSNPDAIYYHRELLCHSLDKLRIELITISSCKGIMDTEEPRFDENLFPDKDAKRCKKFQGKRVIFYFIMKPL